MTDFFVEKYNASDDSFLITDLYKNVLDKVNIGDLLFTIESSKASIDVEAQLEGYIYFNVNVGSRINVNEYFYSITETEAEIVEKPAVLIQDDKLEDESELLISANAHKVLKNNNIDPFKLKLDVISEKDVFDFMAKSKSNFNPVDYSEIIDKENYIVIIGAKGGGKMCIDALLGSKYKILGLLDDSTSINELFGFPILGGTYLVEKLIEIGFNKFVLAFGVLEKRYLRKELFDKMLNLGAEFPNIIHSNAIVEKSVEMGIGNVILGGANIGSSVKLGNLNYINNNALVSHDCSIYNNVHIAPGAVLASNITIKDNSLIGMNTTLYYGLKIGFNVVINNGVNLNSDVEDNLIIK